MSEQKPGMNSSTLWSRMFADHESRVIRVCLQEIDPSSKITFEKCILFPAGDTSITLGDQIPSGTIVISYEPRKTPDKIGQL